MSFLTSLLNPEPAGESQAPDHTRKMSLPPIQTDGQMPQACPQPQSPSDTQRDRQQPQAYPEAHVQPAFQHIPTSTARDAAQALAALSSSDAPPPTAWSSYRNSASRSPTETRSDMRRLSWSTRRSSVHGDGAAPIELPQPPEVARKMSSPSLDQYHVVSRQSHSPEHHRRPSYVLGGADHALTLPPIQATVREKGSPPADQGRANHNPTIRSEEDQTPADRDTASETAAAHPKDEQMPAGRGQGTQALSALDEEEQTSVGQDASVVIAQGVPPKTQKGDAEQDMQMVADNREPAYTRQEPTITQIRQPSLTDPSLSPSNTFQAAATGAKSDSTIASLVQIHNTQPDDSNTNISEPAASNSDTAKPDGEPVRPLSSAQPPFASLKQEHSAHAHSPLRESSVPVQSTEMPVSTVPRKRAAPKSSVKKGTASSVKKEPAAKRRKTDSTAAAVKRSGTPSSQKSKSALASTKRLNSTSATPANSSPAPRSVRNGSSPPRSVASVDQDVDGEAQYSDDDEEEEQGTPDPDADLYCLCKRPDTGTFMIGCDGGCDDWFHGKCVQIAEKDKGLIDRYVCPRCFENGKGRTTWKRMCRRQGCRMPARATSTKKGKKEETASKYCSNACGTQFFKDLVARTRGAAESSSQKSKSRKSVAGHVCVDDLGPRGGALSASELKALMNIATGVDDFKRFGEGILSPPATPGARGDQADKSRKPSTLTDAEEERLADITTKKDATRTRHALLKDRMKLIAMTKQKATTLAESRNLKPKEFCGFDQRMTWTEEELEVWRTSPEGLAILRSGIIPVSSAIDADGDTGMTNGDHEDEGAQSAATAGEVCDKKRCARHHDWAKLALDDTRFEMSENGEVMRALDKEEKEMLQRAGLRARMLEAGGAGGAVLFHGAEAEPAEPAEPVSESEQEQQQEQASGVAIASPAPIQTEKEPEPEPEPESEPRRSPPDQIHEVEREREGEQGMEKTEEILTSTEPVKSALGEHPQHVQQLQIGTVDVAEAIAS